MGQITYQNIIFDWKYFIIENTEKLYVFVLVRMTYQYMCILIIICNARHWIYKTLRTVKEKHLWPLTFDKATIDLFHCITFPPAPRP